MGNASTNVSDDLIATRQSLLSRIKDWGDDDSWRDFFETYWRLIYRIARDSGLQPSDAQEVVQETLVTVSKAIQSFEYSPTRGTFKGWLRNTTRWRINDHVRKMKLEEAKQAAVMAAMPCRPDSTHSTDSFDADWDAEWDSNLRETALERLKKTISPKHFQIFELAFLREWDIAKVAATLQLRAAYVYVVKHRVKAKLATEIKRLRRDPCHMISRISQLRARSPG